MTNWYYYDQTGKKCGPVDSGTLKTLAQHGIITPSTTITNDTGKGAIARDIKGLEFSQNPIPTNMPPAISKSVPVPPVVQIPMPVVTNAISTPLEDSFSRLAGGGSISNSCRLEDTLGRLVKSENKSVFRRVVRICSLVCYFLFIIGICLLVLVISIASVDSIRSLERTKQQEAMDAERKAKAEQESIIEEMRRMRDGYNKIKIGMSYREVVDLVGPPTSQLSETGSGEYWTVLVMWQVGPMANFNVMFQDKKVVSKAQFGL